MTFVGKGQYFFPSNRFERSLCSPFVLSWKNNQGWCHWPFSEIRGLRRDNKWHPKFCSCVGMNFLLTSSYLVLVPLSLWVVGGSNQMWGANPKSLSNPLCNCTSVSWLHWLHRLLLQHWSYLQLPLWSLAYVAFALTSHLL